MTSPKTKGQYNLLEFKLTKGKCQFKTHLKLCLRLEIIKKQSRSAKVVVLLDFVKTLNVLRMHLKLNTFIRFFTHWLHNI